MRLALAQVNARLGDIDGICARIAQQVALAKDQGVQLLCLPAPLFCGVNPGQLIAYPNFEHDLLRALTQTAAEIAATGVTCLVPAAFSLEGGSLFDVVMLKEGRVVPLRLTIIRHHAEMPVSPWAPPVFEVAGTRVAVTFDALRDLDELPSGCDLLIHFSVSGFDASNVGTTGVAAVNEGRYAEEIASAGIWFASMEPVGAFDESVYTGGSFVMDDAGRVVAQAPCFEETLLIHDVERGMLTEPVAAHDLPSYTKETWLFEALRLYVRDAVLARGRTRVVVPLSGDLPSSLLAVLAVDALGSRNVLGLLVEHDDASTPAERGQRDERVALVRSMAENLHIRLVERAASVSSLPLDHDVPVAPSLALARTLDALLLADTAHEQRAAALLPLTKTDYALRASVLPACPADALVPFGDVYLTDLEWIARARNRASAVLPAQVASLTSVEDAMGAVVDDAVCALELDEAYEVRAKGMLHALDAAQIDGALEAHVDRNTVLDDTELASASPETSTLLNLLVRKNETARRVLPAPPVVSARSFDERAWPCDLAWSDTGASGEERLSVSDFAEAEFKRLEARGEARGVQARGEILGFLGSLLGLTPEQQQELFSEDGQRRMREELQEFEGNLREALRHMTDEDDAPSAGQGFLPPQSGPSMPGPSNGFSFFSLN